METGENWYAIQVESGAEERTAVLCRACLPEGSCRECFVVYGERMKRYQGEWHSVRYPVFPGYLFIITQNIEAVFESLRRVPRLTRILGDGAAFIPLTPDETMLLEATGGSEHIMRMSSGYLAGTSVTITSGPMQKMKGVIRHIDRHKRIAVIEVEMFRQKIEVEMGLEVVRKDQITGTQTAV